ncbi:hypothetical protein AB0N99_37265, partial [Streptomyces sp. NPDC093272]
MQRLRALIVQSDAHRDDFRGWTVEKLVYAVWGSPHRAVYEIATTRRRQVGGESRDGCESVFRKLANLYLQTARGPRS